MTVTNVLIRILRNYRHMGPGKFHTFVMKIIRALTDNPKIPASTWGANPNLLATFLEVGAKYDGVYHKANYGSVLDISEREILQQQLIAYLDEMAADLEAESIRNPEILLYCGFDLAKERRGNTRKKLAHAVAEATFAEHHADGT